MRLEPAISALAGSRFTFIDPADLSGAERAVWEALPRIFAAGGGRPRHVTD